MCRSCWYLRLQTHTHNTIHTQFMLIPKVTDTHSQYGKRAVHVDTWGYKHTLTIRYMCSSCWYLRLQTHIHNTVHVQFILIPKATNTHSQYGKCAVHVDTQGYKHTLTIRYKSSSCWYLRLQTHTHNTVNVQFMLIPKATNTHSQYGTCTLYVDT